MVVQLVFVCRMAAQFLIGDSVHYFFICMEEIIQIKQSSNLHSFPKIYETGCTFVEEYKQYLIIF